MCSELAGMAISAIFSEEVSAGSDQVICWDRGRPARNEREARK